MTAVLACPGSYLASGLPVDPCSSCRRRGLDALIGPVLSPAVRWIDGPHLVGYRCVNHAPPNTGEEFSARDRKEVLT
jgi:hypothetical protein